MAKQRITRALTVQQPWAWAIMEDRKQLENRTKRTHIRERIAIHSSKQPDPNWKALATMLENEATRQDCMDTPRGTILGTVELVDCIDVSEEPTFVGPYRWVLARPRLLNKPIQARSNTGIWRVPPDIARRLR